MSKAEVSHPIIYDNLKPIEIPSNGSGTTRKQPLSDSRPAVKKVHELLASLRKYGIYSVNHLAAAGFKYTTNGDTARCDACHLEVSSWTQEMDPLNVHSTRSPNCPVIQSIKSPKSFSSSTISSSCSFALPTPSFTSTSAASMPSSTALVRSAPMSNEQEKPSKRLKIETSQEQLNTNILVEMDKTQLIRRRTFSHWPHRTTPSQAQMIEAGFFNCNVGDRVICIYCNLICQQWTPHTDDPCEVHKILSPNCIYVKAKLMRREPGSILIVNESRVGTASGNGLLTTAGLEQFRFNEFVHTAACHAAYTELPKRTASYAAWPGENLPPVDDLVKAGFFYTGTKNIVTCFYCNGSLQNWGPNDNPTIEHARWFPHCAYAKQLCGDELYRKIQESKRAQQERARANELKDKVGSNASTGSSAASNSRQLLIPDESTLSRLVAARLDLPIAQSLLNQNFKLSIIKRCFEDQLRLKHDDFTTDADLYLACLILQKQIEHIDGKKENIVIPSVRMKKIREDAERERAEALAREQAAVAPTAPVPTESIPITSNSTDIEMRTPAQSATRESTPQTSTPTNSETKVTKLTTSNTNAQTQNNDPSPVNPCVLCLTEEKRLACIPCGHLATCVPCGHSLRSCPMCRREIEAFVRIYI